MNYYFAPMEGIAGYIFRNAFIHNYGGADKYFTPFISGPKLGYKEINDILPENNAAPVLVPQILSNRSDYFLEVVRQLKEYGYDEVNLNLGCPSGTVVSKKRGSGFLSVPDALESFFDEVFSDELLTDGKIKLSVKTRIGMENLNEWERLLGIFAKFPIYELIIHPRLRCELYGGRPHTEAFRQAADFFGSGRDKLVYNGDICSTNDFRALLSEMPFVTSVMIGRGLLKNPEIFLQLKEHFNTLNANNTPDVPLRSDKEKLNRFLNYHNEIYQGYKNIMYGEKPVLFKMKELWTWFCVYAGIDNKELKKIRKAGNLADYEGVIHILF